MTTGTAPPIIISDEAVAQVKKLYEQGLYLQAHRAALESAPLSKWRGAQARVIAGRLAMNLGNMRLARVHHRQAIVEDPRDPQAIYFHARFVTERKGPVAALSFMERFGDFDEAPAQLRAEWLSCRGAIYSSLKDVDRADACFDRAEKLAEDHTWLLVERAGHLHTLDKYEESLAMLRKSLTLRANFRPAVQGAAHALTLLGKDDEALAILTDADRNGESGMVCAQLAALQQELGLYREHRASVERLPELWPIADKNYTKWLINERADAAYFAGDFAASAEIAADSKDDYYREQAKRLTEMLERGEKPSRVILPVGFVRQHSMTCAPATLATLCRFWNRPHEHLEIAEKICYDGTPQPADRAWADGAGFFTREFTVTWESALALIDRGVPFMVCTVAPGAGHAQAVIGYDTLRRTLLIRDPYDRHAAEFIADKVFEMQKAAGPRGLVILPKDKVNLLDGLELPDAELHDYLFTLQDALEKHDRDRAATTLEMMQAGWPAHRITHFAARCIAGYDADVQKILATTEALAKLFPDDLNFELTKLSCLHNLARRDERLKLLEEICTRKQTHPLFWQRYAGELLSDARAHEKAFKWSRKSLRTGPYISSNYQLYGNLLWSQRKLSEAFEYYRFAACLDDKNPDAAAAYFSASLHFKRSREALEMLRAQFDRFATRSSIPARVLFNAYEQIDQTPQAFEMLSDALTKRPDDGELMLFAADAHARYGRYAQAESLLTRAAGKTRRVSWLLYAAGIADMRGDLPQALDLNRQLLALDPLSIEGHRAVMRLLMEIESRSAAVAHLREAVAKFPNHLGLHETLITALRDEHDDDHEAATRALIALHPQNAWARRELAIQLADAGKHDEALAEANFACELRPTEAGNHDVIAYVQKRFGKIAEARNALRHSISLSVDNTQAIDGLVDLADTTQERRAVLAFVRDELQKQVILGDGLVAYRICAGAVLPAAEVLTQLREAHAARPDLWQSWSSVIQQLISTHAKDEALELATKACELFPLMPKLWMDLAEVRIARDEIDAAIAAIARAREIAPQFGRAARLLADLHDAKREFAPAAEILRQSIARTPLDPQNYTALAAILWKLDDPQGTIANIERALHLAPGYDGAWSMLRHFAHQIGKPELTTDLARELTQKKPGDAYCWVLFARTLTEKDGEEQLAAAEKAIALSPRMVDAHDVKAVCLTEMHRYEEAIEACKPAIFATRNTTLRCREAWIMAKRGDLREAIEMMEKVCADDASSQWGWQRLCDWYRAVGDLNSYRRVAEQLVQLWPRDNTCGEYLADVCLLQNDRPRARQMLEQTLARNPDSNFAAITLLNMALNDKRLEDASRLLDHLAVHHIDPDGASARRVRLAMLLKEPKRAAEGFTQLATSTTAASEDWELAVEVLVGNEDRALVTDSVRAVEAAILPLANEPTANKHVAGGLIQIFYGLKRLEDAGKIIFPMQSGTPAWNYAAYWYLDMLAHHKKLPTIHSFTHDNEKALRADAKLWATAGWAFGAGGEDHINVIRWYSDWKTRTDLRPFPLITLCNALRELKRFDEAREVGRRALKLADDGHVGSHVVFMASDFILRAQNEVEFAAAVDIWQNQLRNIEREPLGDFYTYILELTLIVIDAAAAKRAGNFPSGKILKDLAAAEAKFDKAKTDGIIAPLRKIAHKRLAQIAGPRPMFRLRLLLRK